MKYKIGDKIEIRTWEDMAEEYAVVDDGYRHIKMPTRSYFYNVEIELIRLNTNRELIIERIYKHRGKYEYSVREFSYIIDHEWLKKRDITLKEIFNPINSRWEILDIRL